LNLKLVIIVSTFVFIFLNDLKSFELYDYIDIQDTNKISNEEQDLDENNLKPGDVIKKIFTPEQDSVYSQAIRLKIPVSVRLHEDLLRFAVKMKIARELEMGTPWQIALQNLQIRKEYLVPLPQDVVHRQEMIDRSLYVPFMPNRITSGLSVNLQDIGVLLGVVEDLSPVISFDLKYTEEVEIVVYSIQAKVIATIYRGVLQAGTHKYVWNGRDDYGRPMPSGDYVGEVRIGSSRFIRKHIQIP